MLFVAVARGYFVINKIYDENFRDKPELKDLNNLTRGLAYITILMGLYLYKLTQLLDKNIYKNKSQEKFY